MVDMTKVFTVPCEEARSNSTTPNIAHICTRTCSSHLAQPGASPSQLPPNTRAEGKHRRAPGPGQCVLGWPGHWRHPTAVLWGPLASLSIFGRLPAGLGQTPTSLVLNEGEFPQARISLSRKPILLSFLQSTAEPGSDFLLWVSHLGFGQLDPNFDMPVKRAPQLKNCLHRIGL